MKREILLLTLLFSVFVLALFTTDAISFTYQTKGNSESASLLLSGSILIVAGIFTRKRLLRK